MTGKRVSIEKWWPLIGEAGRTIIDHFLFWPDAEVPDRTGSSRLLRYCGLVLLASRFTVDPKLPWSHAGRGEQQRL